MFTEAMQNARDLNQHFHDTGTLKGPLHGLPVSFTDNFSIRGTESGCGFATWLGNKDGESREGLLVRYMRSLGAIPFCKTNVPQGKTLSGTENNIHGSTRNPFNLCLSSGGTAGGRLVVLHTETQT